MSKALHTHPPTHVSYMFWNVDITDGEKTCMVHIWITCVLNMFSLIIREECVAHLTMYHCFLIQILLVDILVVIMWIYAILKIEYVSFKIFEIIWTHYFDIPVVYTSVVNDVRCQYVLSPIPCLFYLSTYRNVVKIWSFVAVKYTLEPLEQVNTYFGYLITVFRGNDSGETSCHAVGNKIVKETLHTNVSYMSYSDLQNHIYI